MAAQGLAHLAEILPQEQTPAAEVPATLPDEADLEPELEASLPADMPAEMAGDMPQNLAPHAEGADEAIAVGQDTPSNMMQDVADQASIAESAELDGQGGLADSAQQPEAHELGQQPEQSEPVFDNSSAPHNGSAPMPQDISAAAPEFSAAPELEQGQSAGAAPAAGPESQPVAPAPQQHHQAQAANPSLAELEDELFPLPAGEEDHYAQPHSAQADSGQSESAQAESAQADSSVFVSGGFLPGSGNG